MSPEEAQKIGDRALAIVTKVENQTAEAIAKWIECHGLLLSGPLALAAAVRRGDWREK